MSRDECALTGRMRRELDEREAAGLLRATASARQCRIDLSTNSYLGLHREGAVARRAVELTEGIMHGNLASRLIASASGLFEKLESRLAVWKGAEAALVFNSGYSANVGVLQALCTRSSEVFCDRLNHASIIDGIRLGQAHLSRYRHRDVDDLRRLLRASGAREKLVVTDSVFSMHGDIAPLADIHAAAREAHAVLMVDEAHASGIFGPSAAGVCELEGVGGDDVVAIGTLSKALAGCGGFVTGTTLLRRYLENTARSLIYSTALPAAALAWNIAALCFVCDHASRGAQVLAKAQRFRQRLGDEGFDTGPSQSQIVPVIVGCAQKAVSLSAFLEKHGIRAPAIRTPTVPRGSELVRFSIGAMHRDGELDEVIDTILKWRAHG